MPNGAHIHYRDQGDPNGEPIVLVHGFGASLFDWTPWVARLGPRYRIISLDLPGHGLGGDAGPAPGIHSMDESGRRGGCGRQQGRVKHFVLAGNSMERGRWPGTTPCNTPTSSTAWCWRTRSRRPTSGP